MSNNLEQTIEKLGHSFEEFKKAQDDRLQALEKNQSTAELDEKLQRIESEMNELSSVKERLENVELNQNRISAAGGQGDISPEAKEHMDAFLKWTRNPKDHKAASELQQKAVSVGTATAGGHALPEIISREIENKLIDLSPMRQVATVENVGTTDYKKLVNVRGASYGWVGETDARSETDTSTLQEVAPTFGTLYAFPQTTEEALNDLFFDVQSWIRNEASVAMSKGEGKAYILGDGSKKPTGFLNGTPENIGDEETSPSRTFGQLEYIKTGDSSGFPSMQDSPPGYPGDVLLDTVYSLKAGYRGNARFLCNKATLNAVRKFKDTEGNYMWAPGLQVGEPNRLLGYPTVEMEDMPDVSSGNFPIAFGDFRAGYLICNLVGMRVTVDDNITTPGYVKFYIRKRVGGKLMNDDAIKVIKCEA